MDRGQVLFLSEREIKRLLTPETVLELVEDVFKSYANGQTVNPIKLSLQIYPYHEGHINCMPSYIEPGDLCGVKLVSVHQNNMRDYGLPTTLGTIVLHDPKNGMPYSIMGGTYITDMRTGAVTGVMAKHLARPNAGVMCVVGAGAQGFTSMQMTLLAIHSIRSVRVCDLSEQRVTEFIKRAELMFPTVEFIAVKDVRKALSGADVAVYATSASAPILENYEIDEGTTVVCVSEKLTPKAVAKFDGWYVDFTSCAIERYNADGRHAAELAGREYEDLHVDMITGEIGDVIIGKTPGRRNAAERLLAASVGMSIEDVVCARKVYEEAVAAGVGTVLDFQDA